MSTCEKPHLVSEPSRWGNTGGQADLISASMVTPMDTK